MTADMRILAIETASEACSVALFDGPRLIAQDHRVLGRGHAERLIPMIAELPEKGRASRILVSLGPGSFTGVRIGIAAARALGFAWGAQVLGYPTLALVAAIARHDGTLTDDAGAEEAQVSGQVKRPVKVCMNGGHGEWFVQDFDKNGLPSSGFDSLRPEQAAELAGKQAAMQGARALIAGNRARELAELTKQHTGTAPIAFDTLPDASRAGLLPPACLTPDLSPIYGRAPDATPQKPQSQAQSQAQSHTGDAAK